MSELWSALLPLAPFVLPVILLAVIVWGLTRGGPPKD